MPITSLPTKTEASLGDPKSDHPSVPYVDPTTQTNAAQLEEMKTRIIEALTELGLTDGSTSGSVNELLRGLSLAIAGTGITVTGNVTVTGTVDGRDVATDGAKLDGIEAGADVTDAANVAAAGAVMYTPSAPIIEPTTARVLSDADHGRVILCTAAGGCAVTVPDTVTPGLMVMLIQRGAAQIIAAGGGAMVVTPAATFLARTAEVGSPMTLYVESATVCNAFGDLEAA
ncbi:MAG: hypothetical protein AB7W59_00080 [Acidimicrobiia bacterium]